MRVTEVRITLANEGKLRAYVVIGLDDSLVIHGLRIIEGTNGLSVFMPRRRQPDGTFVDIVHPINAQTREVIERSVLAEYRRVIGNPSLSVTRSTSIKP